MADFHQSLRSLLLSLNPGLGHRASDVRSVEQDDTQIQQPGLLLPDLLKAYFLDRLATPFDWLIRPLMIPSYRGLVI